MRKLLIGLALAAASAPGGATWREARSAHFIVYSEDKAEALRAFATELERFDAAMRVLRGLQPTTDSPNNRLTVFQVSSVLAVQKAYGKDAANIAGFYEGRAGNSIAFVPRRAGSHMKGDMSEDVVLLHEYAHHFMFRNYPAAFPRWFSEGYAEFNSTARFGEDGSVDLGLPANHRAYDLMLIGQLPVEDMMQADTKPVPSVGLYSWGWMLTHYLYFSKDRAGQLGKYLSAINEGKSSLDAARQAFGDLKRLDRELERYRKSKMTYLRVPAGKLRFDPVSVRELSPGADAIMPVMIRSRRGVDDATAKSLVKDARRIAAGYPDDPFVQLALAEAEIDAGNLDEADRAADKVIAADAASMRAMMFKGRVAAARLEKAKSANAEAWKDVRRWFAKANRAEPGAPEPMIRFYQTYADEGVAPTPNSVEGLHGAALLAPEDEGVRLMLARQYLSDGKGAEAKAALAAAAYNPHGGGLAEAARRVMAAIDKDGPAAGLKAWDEKPADAKAAAAKSRYGAP